jgi:pilus assembly protein FimV
VAPTPAAEPVPAAAAKPAPAPAPAAAQAAAEAGNAHMVKSGDTLSKIAAATKPEGVSLDQMLVALLRGNQGAFDGANMNRLRAGKILNIPNAEAAAAVAAAEARQEVVAQARDFNAYRSKLAAAVAATPAKEEAAKQEDQGKIAPKVADKPAAGEPVRDKLEVSRTEAARETKALQGRITALEEDLVARERALKEANSRVADLEKNLADLKKLAELKSQAGVQAQKQAEAAKPGAPAKPEPQAKMPEPAPVEPPKPAEPPKATEAAPVPHVVEAPKPAEPPPEKKPPVEVAAPSPVPEAPSFIDDNPALVYGGGGLIALLIGYLGFSAWRRKSHAEEAPSTASRLSEGDLMANSVFGTTGGQAVDTSASIQTDFSQASLSAIDTDEGVDPVAEADVYMAYGRDAQAEEILVDALKTDPSRLAIYLKLLEIYSGHKNLAKFEKVATDLHGQTGGAGPDWEKAAAMGRSIDPGNPLYAGSGAQGEAPIEPVIPAVAMPPAGVAAPAAEPMKNTVTLPGQLSQLAESVKPAPSMPANLGFDLDLSTPSQAGSGSAGPLDLDLGAKPVATAAPMESLGIDLSLPDLGTSAAAPAPSAPEPASGLDFEFDIDSTPAPAVKEAPIDFSGINLDLVTAAAPVPEAVEPVLAEGDNPDVNTKLELAQAYEEMGDREGARELLEEVIQEGSVRQQELARSKLATLEA